MEMQYSVVRDAQQVYTTGVKKQIWNRTKSGIAHPTLNHTGANASSHFFLSVPKILRNFPPTGKRSIWPYAQPASR